MKSARSEQTEESLRSVHRRYLDYKLGGSRKYLYVLCLCASLFNFLLLVPDLALIENESGRLGVVLIRTAFSGVLAWTGLRIRKIETFAVFARLAALCEIFTFAVFLYVLCQYRAPDFLIQAMGVIIIIIVFFFVPNRWGHTLLIAAGGVAGFFACSGFFTRALSQKELWGGLVYVALTLALCAFSARNAQRHEFREFLARRELERLSSTDYLTAAANRFKMEEEAGRWMDFCRRNGMPLSLVFLDVDNLKEVNDRYGHPAGDRVLENLAGLIGSHLRSSDILGRWGGDEFVLLLPNVSVTDAKGLAQRLRMFIREGAAGRESGVTCSFGVAGMTKDTDFKALIGEADRLMYEAKKLGKDNVRSAEDA